MRTFKQWVREDEELIKKWLKTHGVRYTLLTLAWVSCLTYVFLSIIFGWRHLDIELVGKYIPKKLITAASNVMMLYLPLLLLNFALGNPFHEVFRRKDVTPDDRRNVVIFFSVLAVITGYLVSIGA